MPTWHKEIKFKAGTYIKQQKFLIRQSVDLPRTTSDSFLEMTSKKSSDGRILSASVLLNRLTVRCVFACCFVAEPRRVREQSDVTQRKLL